MKPDPRESNSHNCRAAAWQAPDAQRLGKRSEGSENLPQTSGSHFTQTARQRKSPGHCFGSNRSLTALESEDVQFITRALCPKGRSHGDPLVSELLPSPRTPPESRDLAPHSPNLSFCMTSPHITQFPFPSFGLALTAFIPFGFTSSSPKRLLKPGNFSSPRTQPRGITPTLV